jgi:hypothetical protein
MIVKILISSKEFYKVHIVKDLSQNPYQQKEF